MENREGMEGLIKAELENWDEFYDLIFETVPEKGHLIHEQMEFPGSAMMLQYPKRQEHCVPLPTRNEGKNDFKKIVLLTITATGDFIANDVAGQLEEHGFDPKAGKYYLKKFCEITETSPETSGQKTTGKINLKNLDDGQVFQIRGLVDEYGKILKNQTGYHEWCEEQKNEKDE